ncbi:DUF2851 family protein [Runella zeae]|uniref:DUF2851 family protein n=1 Tax=Runella zeae TaxID=94255 RepID=UPI0023571592|nr:DUF2851 family protein [Runella zeae]
MSEDFLYFLWQFQYFDKTNLATAANESLQVLATGMRNTNAGPDFLNGRVVIAGIEWAGNIEMHLRSSDWLRHSHHQDPFYDSVILHIVWENDSPILRADGTPIPTLALKPLTSILLLQNYHTLLESQESIPCAGQFENVSDLQKRSMLDRVMMQRLQRKASVVHEMLERNKQDWEETAYQLLAQNFGFKINAEPMLRLAQGLPLKILQKHRDNLLQIEALVFGQAGLIPAESDDNYILLMQKEHLFLTKKYTLSSTRLLPHEWKFLRLRPTNFPTIRLAQLSALIQQHTSFFSMFIHIDSLELLIKSLQVTQSEYWHTHYQFHKKSAQPIPPLGKTSIQNIVINTAIPLLVAYSEAKNNRNFLDKALEWLEKLPGEQNHITQLWKTLQLRQENAFDSQATIELYNNFCQQKKCLQCSIGTSLLRGR